MGQNEPEGQGLFCAEINPGAERLEPSKTVKNPTPPCEIAANGGVVILIGSNSISSQNANKILNYEDFRCLCPVHGGMFYCVDRVKACMFG
jgi:hypothetical protein